MIALSTDRKPMRSNRKGNQMATILNCKDIAIKLDTDTRTLRKFLRSDDRIESVGKGGRYSIELKEMRSLTTRFKKWDAMRNLKESTPEV